MLHKEKVQYLHQKGYNCAQALLCTYQEELQVDEKVLFGLAEGLGRGVAGLENMCCIPIVMTMICSMSETCDYNLEHPQSKFKTYACGKCLIMDFKEKIGSICCYEIIQNNKKKHPQTSCTDVLIKSVEILDDYLNNV